jgi:hypothetical protein
MRLNARLCFLLGIVSMHSAAIDPGIVKGQLGFGGEIYTLRNVYAWQPAGQVEELWVYVTDTELPAAAAQDRVKPAELAKENRFRGVKLVIRPKKPTLNSLRGVLYSQAASAFNITGKAPRWRRLLVGDKRVVGKLKYASAAWSLDVEFSAPVFGGGGKADNSPQARVTAREGRGMLQ